MVLQTIYNENSQALEVFLHKAAIQKIYSTPHYIVMSARSPGKTVYLYLGRGGKYRGAVVGGKIPPSKFRGNDRFLQFLRKNLRSGRIEKIVEDSTDNILSFYYWIGSSNQKLSFFWKGDLLYFIHHDGERAFCSWCGYRDQSLDELEELFEEVGKGELSNRLTNNLFSSEIIDEYLSFLERESGFLSPKKKQKFQKRKVANIEEDLKRVRMAYPVKERLVKEVDNIANLQLMAKELRVKVPKEISGFYKIRDYLFEKIKSFEKAVQLLEKRLEDAKAQLNPKKNGPEELIQFNKLLIRPYWPNSGQKNLEKFQDSNFKEWKLKDGSRVAVGRNTRENDELRTRWAKKDDYWFHLDGDKSAHLFLKTNSLEIGGPIFLGVVDLLAEQSGIERSEVQVLFTQVKNIKGVKGSPGKVTYKKEKHVRVSRSVSWKDIIF